MQGKIQDPGQSPLSWPFRKEPACPGKAHLCRETPGCVDPVPEIGVRSGELSCRRRCVGERKLVDGRQGRGLPSSCLVGTDIRLETVDEAVF